jgi:hypothetical protein
MDKKIILAIRKVLNETRYEDLKSNIEDLRNRWGTQISIVSVLHGAVLSIKNILTFNFSSLFDVKEEYRFHKKTMDLAGELYYLEKIIREIKIRDKEMTLKKDDLEYYGFDYEKLINELNEFLNKYEPYVISKGGYIRDKNDKEFTEFMKQLKPLRKLKDLLEGLE